jgi:hypothetical protein
MIIKDFILQPGDGREVFINDIMLPKVEGMALRFRGDWIRPTASKWDFSFIDRCVARMEKANKPFSLLPMSGDSTAQWLVDSLPSSEKLNDAPLPWSPRNIEYVVAVYEELGKRYNKHQLCKHVHITGGTRGGTSEEMHPDPKWGLKNDGRIIGAYEDFIDAAARSFTTQTLWLAISGQKAARGYVNGIVEFGIKELGGRFGVKNNALKSDTSLSADHNTIVVNAAKRGTKMGFEMARAQGSRLSKAVANAVTLGNQAKVNELIIFHYPPDLKYVT